MIAVLQGLLGHRQRLLDRRGPAAAAGEALDELLDLAFGQRADEAVDRPSVLEGIDGGDRLDAHLLRDLGVLVDVELDHADGAVGVAHGLFQDRAELLAGAAPRRPEIDDDRRVERAVDDLGHEGGGGDVLYRSAAPAAPPPIKASLAIAILFLEFPTTWPRRAVKTSAAARTDSRRSAAEDRAICAAMPAMRR